MLLWAGLHAIALTDEIHFALFPRTTVLLWADLLAIVLMVEVHFALYLRRSKGLFWEALWHCFGLMPVLLMK